MGIRESKSKITTINTHSPYLAYSKQTECAGREKALNWGSNIG